MSHEWNIVYGQWTAGEKWLRLNFAKICWHKIQNLSRKTMYHQKAVKQTQGDTKVIGTCEQRGTVLIITHFNWKAKRQGKASHKATFYGSTIRTTPCRQKRLQLHLEQPWHAATGQVSFFQLHHLHQRLLSGLVTYFLNAIFLRGVYTSSPHRLNQDWKHFL